MTAIPKPNTIKALTLKSSTDDSFYSNEARTFEEFSEILSRAPQLAPHVRSLSLQFLPGHSSASEAAAALTAILAKLDSINTLAIPMEAIGDESTWSSFSPGVQVALQTALLRPALTTLRLSHLKFDSPTEFVSALTQASQLRELCISEVILKSADDDHTILPSKRLSLHTLKIDCYMTTPQLLRLVARIIDPSRLQHLLTFINPDLEAAACELLASAVNVKYFHIRLEEYSDRAAEHLAINLRPLRELRTLEITLDLHVASFSGDPVWCAKQIIKSTGADAARLDEGGDQVVYGVAEDNGGEEEYKVKDKHELGSGDKRNSVVTNIIFNVDLNDLDQGGHRLTNRTMDHLADMLDDMTGVALNTVTFRIACEREPWVWDIVNKNLRQCFNLLERDPNRPLRIEKVGVVSQFL
ncbi:hypothetical protein GGX14DRAFT_633065 [Mycena pura]|uniref:Uncharacterized protein n=1 Tax=Mycena pura TaxID=153505 RepID=A0AAD6VCW8_9AGAR|nr:hypothetical protein GGX14DRAFT_633065 [Mycena pura]